MARHDYNVGDVLYSSWGYDQTNIDFYVVLKVTASTITIRELASVRDYTGDMQGVAMPGTEFAPRSEEMVKRPRFGRVKIEDYAGAYKWDGKPMRFSTYA